MRVDPAEHVEARVKAPYDIGLRDAAIVLHVDGQARFKGIGSDCLGDPPNAAPWLARQCTRLGGSPKAGDVA